MAWRYIAGFGTVLATAAVTTTIIDDTNKNKIKRENKELQDKCGQKWVELHKKFPNKYNGSNIIISLKDPKPNKPSIFEDDVPKGIHFSTATSFINQIQIVSKNITVDTPVDLVLFVETCGGELGSIKMICDAIKTFKTKYKGKCYVVIDKYALSGGSLIALSADEIMMDDYACLSKTDPQVFGISARKFKNMDDIVKANGLIAETLSNISTEAMGTVMNSLDIHVKPNYTPEQYEKIIQNFIDSDNIHGYTFSKLQCLEMGLRVIDIPDGITIKP
jgi:ATP-dependent protease ClpP protease subunit